MNDTLLVALAMIPALVIAIVFHEVARGWTGDQPGAGDDRRDRVGPAGSRYRSRARGGGGFRRRLALSVHRDQRVPGAVQPAADPAVRRIAHRRRAAATTCG